MLAVDTVAPPKPGLPDLITADDTGVNTTDNVTGRTQPTFSGTVEANAVVDVYVNGVLNTTGVASAMGLYSIKLQTALAPDGTYPVTIKATDKAGNVSAVSPSLAVTVNTVAPSASAFPVVGPAAKSYKAGDVLSFSVRFTSPVTVTGLPTLPLMIGATSKPAVYASGSGTDTLVFRRTVVAGDNGAVSLSTNEITLPVNAAIKSTINGFDATRTFVSPVLTDVIVDTVAPSKPGLPNLLDADDSGWSSTDNLTNKSVVTLNGSGEANGSVAVYRGATVLGTVKADGSGGWSLSSVSLLAGANAFTVKVTDGAGNVSVASDTLKVTRDGTAPTTPGLPDLITADDTGVNTTDNVTGRTQPTFSGTVEANAVVDVYVNGVLNTTGVASAMGLYSIKLQTALAPDGTYPVTIKATDKAGNVSAVSPSLAVTVNTVAPSASAFPVVGPAAKSYKAGDVLSFSVRFTSPVTVTGLPTLPLMIGATSKPAVYASGSGTDTLVFRRTVVAGDNGAVSLSTNEITLPVNAAIKSTINGFDATRTFVSPVLTDVIVDTVAPVVNSMSIDGSVTSDTWVRTSVITFSRPVKGVSIDDFQITGYFFGATRTVRLNDSNVASVVGGVRAVPLDPVNGHASVWYLDVKRLTLENGSYTIRLIASGSNSFDEVGNAMTKDGTLSLTVPLPLPT